MENSRVIAWGILSGILIVAELIYFKIADRFNIIDKPNERSSHAHPIIRGGGIIFLLAVIIWYFHFWQWHWFVLAVVIISVISFLDDVASLDVRWRFLFQFIVLGLLFFQLWPINWPAYLLILAVPFCVGTINAFNFMDGINGITGIYSLVTLGSFLFINQNISFTNSSLLLLSLIAVLIFLFFNFRKSARCFAGDVGSVSMALILIFILLQLIKATGNFLWPLLFLVYGTDALVTIYFRLKRGENILKPHRSHLYQYLTNELKISHLVVSAGYGIMQALINVVVIYSLMRSENVIALIAASLFVLIYFSMRNIVMRKINASSFQK